MARKLLMSGVAVAGIGVCSVLLNHYLTTPRTYDDTSLSEWRPDGPRYVAPENPVLGVNDTFRSLHGSTRNSDEVLTAVAPEVELDWVVEQDMFITEGPSIDREGNLYFSPVTPKEHVVLVSLDGKTGERRWTIEGYSQGGGAPLVLDDPDRPGEQIIYLTLYERALAVRPDGEIIWDVQTGLKKYIDPVQGLENSHNFGANYLPQADAIVSVVMDGTMIMLDRKTGRLLLPEPFIIPGAPAKPSNATRIPQWLLDRADAVAREAVGEDPTHGGRFSRVMDILFGGGVKVANYFSIDPATGRIFVAATAEDEDDGVKDGLAANGAIYGIDVVRREGKLQLAVAAKAMFEGGTGSTPALTADGKRIYTSDEHGHVIAYDRDLNELWRHNVGEQVLASITVASEGNELYVATLKTLYKLFDRGDRAEGGWSASLDMYPELMGAKNINLLTATVTANGIAMMAGNGILTKSGKAIPLTVGVGLLDRETGKVIGYTQGLEESVATTITGPDGGFYIGHSPVRRALSKSLMGPLVNDLTGGIARYKPVNRQSLSHHILCSASIRAENASTYFNSYPASALEDLSHVRVLLRQLNEIPSNDRASSIGDFDELLNSADRGGAKQLAIELSNACEFVRADSEHQLASK
ncbi:hypothetical protein [Endozoicomonas sp.]|uniref:hypothetical protein n=1 Tax=Endozoicomonas sp. TaxID=1892382 RepID=UPI003AF5C51A